MRLRKQKMRLFIAWLITVVTITSAHALPQGSWPDEASHISLSKKDWILVIPARRSQDGEIILWDKDDPWLKQWIVPRQTPSGIKTVAITGDAEDKSLIHGWHVENMEVDALRGLSQKYKAPAIAVAVMDEDEQVAVAGWVSGEGAAWRFADMQTSSRVASLQALDDIFKGYSDYQFSPGRTDVFIAGQREVDGWLEYLIEAAHPDTLERIRRMGEVQVFDVTDTEIPSIIVRITDGRDIETVLRSVGISYR